MLNECYEQCSKCNQIEDVIYFDTEDNIYCEDCWIQHEAEIKGLLDY